MCSFLCEGSAVWPPRHPPGRDSRLGKGAGARATTRGGVRGRYEQMWGQIQTRDVAD